MLQRIIKIFLFWRIGLLAITYIGAMAFPLIANSAVGAIAPGKTFDYWASWAQWDGGHYLDIAENGYIKTTDYAFFPLFPLLARTVSEVTGLNLIAAGLLITNISFFTFLIVFFKLLESRYNQKIAFNSLISFLLFPTSFFAVGYYSESLFLLFALLVFTSLKERNFLLAAIFSSLASLSRLIGVMLIISVFWAYFESIKFKISSLNFKFIHASIAIAGIAAYSFYLLINANDPLKFFTSQSFWQREVTDPLSTIVSYMWPVISGEVRPFNDWLDLALTLLFVTILILGIKKISPALWIFSILAILIPAASGSLTGMPRYLLASIGTFVIVGQYLSERPKLKIVVWTTSILLQIFFAVRFINGYWVA